MPWNRNMLHNYIIKLHSSYIVILLHISLFFSTSTIIHIMQLGLTVLRS
jgi:hypothetical protein